MTINKYWFELEIQGNIKDSDTLKPDFSPLLSAKPDYVEL